MLFGMHRVILLMSVVCALTLSFAQSADAALYRGGGKAIRVELRVKGMQIVFAKVRTTLRCTDRDDDRRRLRRFGAAWGVDQFPPDVNEIHTRPIDLLSSGRFEASYDRDSAPEEEGFWNEELFVGRVKPSAVEGVFAYEEDYHSPHRDEVCRTSHFRSFGSKLLRFRAVQSRSR